MKEKNKKCNSCKKVKKTSEFGKYRNKCKDCYNIAKKEHYKKTRKMMEKFLWGYYNDEIKCERCGVKSEWGIMFFEWHHKDPATKEKHISNMLGVNNKEALIKELEKCECLCPTCHKLVHLETWGSATRWHKH